MLFDFGPPKRVLSRKARTKTKLINHTDNAEREDHINGLNAPTIDQRQPTNRHRTKNNQQTDTGPRRTTVDKNEEKSQEGKTNNGPRASTNNNEDWETKARLKSV